MTIVGRQNIAFGGNMGLKVGGFGHGEKLYSFRTSDFCKLFKVSKYTFAKWRREKKIDASSLEDIIRVYNSKAPSSS